MKSAYVYLQLYKLFDNVTPIKVDCGLLCGSACCKGDDAGMFLFPGEEAVYRLLEPDWIKIEPTELTYEFDGQRRTVSMALCSGECDRFERPLACRIFPLTPYIKKDGSLDIIMDPRAKGVCRLARGLGIEDLSPLFVKNVKRVFALLCKNRRIYAFLKEYSAYLDEFMRFFQ